MNAKRRKQSFRPSLENNDLERRVVLSVTAGSAVAARAMQAQRNASIAEVRAERRAVQLERRAEQLETQAQLRVNRQITQAFNQFSRVYNVSQNQYMRAVRQGNPNALTALQSARTNGLNNLAGQLGTIYARFPQGTGTLPTVDSIIGSAVSSINSGAGGTTGLNGNTGAGGVNSIDPGTPLSLFLSLGAYDTQNLTGRNLLTASRGAINTAMQSTLGTVGTYLSANPLLGTQVSNGFNNPTGLGTTSGVVTGGFGGTTTTGTTGIGMSSGFNNPTGLINNITGYTTGISFYGPGGTNTSTGLNGSGTGLNGSTANPTTTNITGGIFNPFLGNTGTGTVGTPPYQVTIGNPSNPGSTTGDPLNNPTGSNPTGTTTNPGNIVTTTSGSGANNNNYSNNFYQGTGISPGIDNGFNNGLTYGFNTGLGLGFTSAGTAALSPGFSGGLAIR